MSNPIGAMVGPGSQPADEDGGVLDYMSMPSGMMTFSTPNLPEAEDTEDLATGKAALEHLLQLLEGYDPSAPAGRADFSKLDAANLELVNQVLGEGEVSVIGGAALQAQEAVLAGVWRVREADADGRLVADYAEVSPFPEAVLTKAFDRAQAQIAMPDRFGPNIFNAPPLLPEINDYVARSDEATLPHVINLSLLPHTEEDLGLLNDLLGRGEITILSRGYGNCRITATVTKNAWWVQFYNSQDTLILNTIEICRIPEVACAAPEDIADSADRLNEILEVYR
jgi:hydrogenase-1 operon protein HyaF